MDVLIYGGGAVGLGLASCLIKAGARVHLHAREETVHRLRAQGLQRTGIFGTFQAPAGTFGCAASLDEIGTGPLDFILVCVKSFDTEYAARDLARAFAAHPEIFNGAAIVLCQNGWGNYERFTAILPRPRIYNARVITGFRRPRPNEVEITVHADAVRVGCLGRDPLEVIVPLCDRLRAGGLPCEPTERVGRDLWAKMLYNCSLNPLGALFDVPYGALAEEEATRQVMHDIHAEAFAVMRAAGHETHWATLEDYERRFYEQMVPSTAAHCSSMLQDMRAGKRTEIGAMNGAIVELGERHAVATPVNRTIERLVQYAEARGLRQRVI